MLSNSGLASSSNPGSQIEIKHNIFMFSIGPEFSFSLTGSPIKPYAGLDLIISTFSGETMFQGVSQVPSGTYSMSSAARTGIGVGLGQKLSRQKCLDIV
jgi:hypothetical protein